MGAVGSVTASMIPVKRRDVLWASIAKTDDPDGCWLWTGYVFNKYGRFSFGFEGRSRKIRAHRAAWELTNGQAIPPGMTLDHLCGQPLCCNPRHLEPVGHSENLRRRHRGGTREDTAIAALLQLDIERATTALEVALRYATTDGGDPGIRAMELLGCQTVLDELRGRVNGVD